MTRLHLKLLLLLFTCVVASQLWAAESASQLVANNCEFPEVYEFTPARCTIQLQNSGSSPIHVSSFKTLFPDDLAIPGSLTVKPHSDATVDLHISTSGSAGHLVRYVDFATDEPGHEKRRIEALGYVMSALDEPRPKLDLGNIDTAQGASTKELAIGSHEVADFRITRVLESPDWLNVAIGDNHSTLVATIEPGAPWGVHEGVVKLAINTPRQKEAWVDVKANIHGEIAPPGNPLWFGFRSAHQKQELLVPLVAASGKDFPLGKLTVEGIDAKAVPADCDPPSSGCKAVKLTWAGHQRVGLLRATLDVELPSFKRKLPIQIMGFLTSDDPDASVDLNGSSARPGEKSGTSGKAATPSTSKPAKDSESRSAQSSEVASGRASAKAEGNSSPKPMNRIEKKAADGKKLTDPAPTQPTPPGTGPLLKWTVEHEDPVYGYQIFRADSEQGPFMLQNIPAIPVDHDHPGTRYQWRDQTAEPGTTYWYYIGIANKNGTKKVLSKPHKTVAK